MKIPIDRVQQAKEMLGDKAANIIASGLNIYKWDAKNLKGCCPFHTEKTPSFVWDKKHNIFKCFGCGTTYDILDFYMRDKSFTDACKELFNEVGLMFDYDIKSPQKLFNKENEAYRFPEPVTKNENEDKMIKYMNLRKISEKTIAYTGVKLSKNNWIVFEYRDDEEQLLTVKYRYCGKYDKKNPPKNNYGKVIPKTFCQSGKDTSPILWGMNQINPTKPLLITEGETDRLAAIESGFMNTVSVPFGANNYTWIEHNWEWLEQFEKIYIWADNDEAGDNMRKEVVPRLGEERCWVVRGKYNDINVQLFKDGKQSVLNSIQEAKQVPIPDTITLLDVTEFDINKAEKIPTPYNGLNKYINGFVLGTVNVITGINSSGKSTLINHMCIAHPLELGYKVWIFSGELTPQQLKNWVQFPISGPEFIKEFDNGPNKPKGYAVLNTVKPKITDEYKDDIFMYANEFDYTSDNILKRMEQLAKVKGVKVFLLDNLMMIDLKCGQFDLNMKQKEFMVKLKIFARRYNAVVHLVAHPRKTNEIRRLTKMDVAGTGDITNLADYVIAVHRVLPSEKEDIEDKKGNIIAEGCPYDTILDLFKNRPLGHQDKAIGLYFDYPSKRFYGEDDDLQMEYRWIKNNKVIEVTEKTDKEIDVPW